MDVHSYWSGEPVRLEKGVMSGDALLWPPIQRPRVPILVGGTGEQVTLRRVAQHADMRNFEEMRVMTADECRHKLDVLRGHCEAVGRPYESIIKSYFLNGVVLATTTGRLEAKVAALGPLFADDARRNMGTPSRVDQTLRACARGWYRRRRREPRCVRLHRDT